MQLIRISMDALKIATPVEERIASYKLNDISVLAGDINEFNVLLNYDFTTDSDNYSDRVLNAQGKGTWRMAHLYGDKGEVCL